MSLCSAIRVPRTAVGRRRSFALQPIADVVSNSHRSHCVAVHHVHVRVHWRRPSHHRVRQQGNNRGARWFGACLRSASRTVAAELLSLMPVTEHT
jgi:hypothetical protein